MKFTNIFKAIFRPVTRPITVLPTFIGFKQIAESAKGILKSLKPVFITPKSTEPLPTDQYQAFEENMTRFNLTEQDLVQRKKEFFRLTIIYLLVAVVLFVYVFYLMWRHSIHGAIAAFAITLICFGQAFRYHFWLFQIKQRRLGCSFGDWMNSSFMGEKQ